jgi:uncharacterized protein YecE (DUF72 family)
MSKIHIGTSGWAYQHWYDVFYPDDLASNKLLEFYSEHFDTVELNTTFYHLPKPSVFAAWYKKTPKNFIFSVKASRFITHVKKIKDCEEPWQRFINSAKELKEKLGPILFQLPPSLKADKKGLEGLLEILPKKYSYCLEPRHETWFSEEIYDTLKKYYVALCLADSPKYPLKIEITAPFVYIRFHGGKILYGSKYSEKELKTWAERIKNWQKQNMDVYVYFNNDYEGYAIENAKQLKELLK